MDHGRGRDASTPTDIPTRGWRDVASRTLAEAKAGQLTLLAAGVAFFGLLAADTVGPTAHEVKAQKHRLKEHANR